jgi:hypothetical protein
MMQIKPQLGKEIDFAEIRNIVYGLKTIGFNIAKVTADSYQSASILQDLRKKGFEAETFSLDRTLDGYATLKELICLGRCRFYPYEPFLNELRRLELIDGRKVEHPSVNGGSKDVADAVAGCVYQCIINQNDIQFWFAGARENLKPWTDEERGPYGYRNGRIG